DLIPTLRAMMARLDIDPGQYVVVDRPADIDQLLTGDIPVWGAYLTGLTVALQETGNRFNLIFPDDYGVHFYAGSVYATDDFLAAHPGVVVRFLRAALKGWANAVASRP